MKPELPQESIGGVRQGNFSGRLFLFRLFRWWFALGTVAFAAVIAIYWLMVAKPLPMNP